MENFDTGEEDILFLNIWGESVLLTDPLEGVEPVL